jgi:putative ABC transport system substrate-binding protein
MRGSDANVPRRAALGALAAIALFPRAGLAQPSQKIVGVLVGQGTRAQGQWRIDVITAGLKKQGWVEGQNLRLEFRWPEGDVEQARRDAAELAGIRADVLVATNTLSTKALIAATPIIPIVFVNVTDPIGSGIVASFARPGKNVTGFTDMDPTIAGKWVELLRELVPTTRAVAMIYNPDTEGPFVAEYRRAYEDAARRLGVETRIEHVRAADEYATVFRRCNITTNCAAIMLDDPLFSQNLAAVMKLAIDQRIPVMHTFPGYAIRDGGLIGYNVHLLDLYTQGVGHVDRILRGEKPGDLPVQMPVKFQLAINRTVAASMGIDVPTSILARADHIIE